jgi:hypothetical protein
MAWRGQRDKRPIFTGFGSWPLSANRRTCFEEQPRKPAISFASTIAADPNGEGRVVIVEAIEGGTGPVATVEGQSSPPYQLMSLSGAKQDILTRKIFVGAQKWFRTHDLVHGVP